MYQFGRFTSTGILIVHRKRFETADEAFEWNERTGIAANFELVTIEQVEQYAGWVHEVPLGEDDGSD